MANPDDTFELNRILMEIANLKSNKSVGEDNQPEVELTRQESPKKVPLNRMQTSFLGV